MICDWQREKEREGLEMAALTERQEAALKMSRFLLGMTTMDGIRNESITGTAQSLRG